MMRFKSSARGWRLLALAVVGALLLAGAAIVALAFLAAYGGVLSSLWRDAVAFHLNAESAPVPGAPSSLRARAAEVFDALTGRPGAPTVFFVLLVVGVTVKTSCLDVLPPNVATKLATK